MHSIETFIKLFRDETQLTHVFNETVTLQNIRQDFPAIAQASGFPPGDISMAYVAGSYARGQQTAHSDIDIECYSAAITQEYQSTFKWKGYLIAFSVYPAGTAASYIAVNPLYYSCRLHIILYAVPEPCQDQKGQ